MKIKNHFSPSERVVPPSGPRKPAQQQFKDDADINSIMRKFQKTGAINHAAKYQGEYGAFTPHTLHQAMNIQARAKTMFEELPSMVRNYFKNSASAFFDFVQDPANAQKAKELGIGLSTEAAEAAAAAALAASEPPGAAKRVSEKPPMPEGSGEGADEGGAPS